MGSSDTAFITNTATIVSARSYNLPFEILLQKKDQFTQPTTKWRSVVEAVDEKIFRKTDCKAPERWSACTNCRTSTDSQRRAKPRRCCTRSGSWSASCRRLSPRLSADRLRPAKRYVKAGQQSISKLTHISTGCGKKITPWFFWRSSHQQSLRISKRNSTDVCGMQKTVMLSIVITTDLPTQNGWKAELADADFFLGHSLHIVCLVHYRDWLTEV